jgi:diguanylate cyclase (GGDEF)-like protein
MSRTTTQPGDPHKERPTQGATPPPAERRATKTRCRNSLLAHPALNLGAILGCGASAILVGFVALLLRRAGVAEGVAIILAWPPAVLFGWLVVDALVIRKLHRTSEQIGQLRRQLRLYASVSTRDLFERILLKTNDDLGQLSQDIHAALTAAHQDRLESARMRRNFTHSVERETQRATHHLTRMSQTDQLTGLGNRRAFDEALETMVEEARSLGRDLACVSLDMDKFKNLNDTHGHAAGDAVLEAMGEVLSGSIRPIDFAARLGGDEFVLLLADCDVEEGQRLCERICRLFGQHPEVTRFGADHPTVSYGLAALRERRGRTAAQLLEASDQAMYQAKRSAKAAQAA